MDYIWLKALHVAMALTWIGGLLTGALALADLSPSRTASETERLAKLKLWDRYVTSPAMLTLWGLGIVMATEAGWFHARWLMVKLVIALALSGLHGVVSGTLRRVARDPQHPVAPWLRHGPASILVAILAIAILAVVKPF